MSTVLYHLNHSRNRVLAVIIAGLFVALDKLTTSLSPALDATYVITNDFMIYLGTHLFEWARHCSEDRERVEVIRDFLGEGEPMWYRRT